MIIYFFTKIIILGKYTDIHNFYYQNPHYDYCFFTNTEDFNIAEIQIFPNPATSILNIVSEENIESIEILNISGQVVNYKTVSNNIAKVDISALSSGIYFAKIYLSDNILVNKFVVE
ncbi:MAG TPA: T9SS type A sorting domain-containing protein [Bacteroidales bacterium]|nr:T9SS type A sorting domain-containing protein [Bacteroidales bacterium]